MNYLNGEGFLALNHPVYKRRYVSSCDLVLGCRIGCDFCYYKHGPTAPLFQRGAAELRPLADPSAFARIIRDSLMVRPGDGVIVSARSDLSMPEHKQAFSAMLDRYDYAHKPVSWLILQRGVYSARDWHAFGAHPVFFGTTITPQAAARGYNTVRDEAQLRGLAALRDAGCPASRISIELGPILPDTVDDAIAVARVIARDGLAVFLTYRGASVGQYGDYHQEIERLRARGFFRDFAAPTYDTGSGEARHEYYLLKNHIDREIEAAFLAGVADLPLRCYRHTGHMYRREWGLKVAASRNNRVRDEMLPYALPQTLDQYRERVRSAFGLDCPVEAVNPDAEGRATVFRLQRRGTEDIAHAIGAETRTATLFSDFSNQPALSDLDWYRAEGWLVPVAAE